MHQHAPSTLTGPITWERPWWPRHEDSTTQALLEVDVENAADPGIVPDLEDPDIRADLVRRVRQEIAEGTYDTPDKWDKALDRLFEDLDEE
ncbi:MAG: flagellar biosynthesis anti-sigma factor FlgM [Gemmataceae bacterium]